MLRKIEGTVELCAKVSPLKSFTIDNLGFVSRVVVNGGGGMGGSRTVYYGVLHPSPEPDGLHMLKLPASERNIRVNLGRYVSTDEVVNLWRATTVHDNGNFDSPMVEYFVTNPKTKVKALNRQNHDKTVENVFGLIDPELC